MKSYLPAVSLPYYLIESKLKGDVSSIDFTLNDTIKYTMNYIKNKNFELLSNNLKIKCCIRLGRVNKIQFYENNKIYHTTHIFHLFPIIIIFNNGVQCMLYHGFEKVNRVRELSGFTTMSKRKIRYKNGKVSRIKHYDWQTVAQKSLYVGYNKYNHINDTITDVYGFDRNDSLAFISKHQFDKIGNIKTISTLTKKRTKGFGIDVTFYAYDGNHIENSFYEYVFDSHGNWAVKKEYINEELKNVYKRKISYKTGKL